MSTGGSGSRRGTRREVALGVAAAVASVAVLCWVGADVWFRKDAWDFLLRREAGSLDSWLRPHGGHLQLPAVGLHRLLYAAAGPDFWPWYYLPHLIGHAAVAFYVWRVLLRRGADRLVAFAAYLVLLFLGVSYYLSSIAVGSLIVLALLLWVAQRIDAGAEPSPAGGVLLAAALVTMVAASSEGVAALAACAIVVLASPKVRRWWWGLVPAAVLYGSWYAAYGAASPVGGIDWEQLGGLPGRGLRLLGAVATRGAGLPGEPLAYGAVLALGLTAALWWLARRGALGRFDAVLTGTTAFYVLMVIAVRAAETGQEVADRHVYGVVMLLVPLLVPHLRFGARWPAAARVALVVLVGSGLLGFNVWLRVDATEHVIEARSRRLREAAEQVGGLVAAGDPGIDALTLREDLGLPAEAGVTVGEVRRLVSDGWEPPPMIPDEVAGLRAAVRFFPLPALPPGGAATPLGLEWPAGGGCLRIPASGSLRAAVTAGGGFRLEMVASAERRTVEVTWEDRFGRFPATLVFEPGSALPTRVWWVDGTRSGRVSGAVLAVAAPAGETHLTIADGGGADVFLCPGG